MTSLLIVLATSLAGPAAWAAGPTIHFDIPAGAALKTLPQFYSQSKIEMLYLSDKVRNLTTRAVAGDLEAPEALRRMLEGTGLEFAFESDYSFVSIKPAAIATPTEPLTLVASAAGPDARRSPADLLASLDEEQKLEEVIVTGTLIHGALDVMSPLIFVTGKEMKRTGYATVQDALQALPVSFGGGPSEDFGGTGNFNRGVSVNLRGLGAGATLVLVNGHRQPFSGAQGDFVDVSNIPWSAVDRIEVLPDGASALYGSDAIAGVVNVIMRKDLDGAETQARIGAAPGGADESLLAQLFGTTWESGNVLLSYQYSRRTALAAAQRAYAADADKTPFGGSDYRTYRSNPGNILDPRTLVPAYAIPAGQDGSALVAAELQANEVNLQNRYSSVELLPDRRMHSMFFSGSQRVSERLELLAEARYSRREIAQQLFAADQLLVVPSTNPSFVSPFAGAPSVVVAYSFLDDLGPITAGASTQNYAATIGMSARLTDAWRLAFSQSYGREKMRYAAANQVDQVALSKALADDDAATAFNPFGDGAHNNPATLDAIRTAQSERAASSIATTSLIADGAVLNLPAGPAKLAVGAEWRTEMFEHGGFVPSGPFERTVKSAFAELSIPIVGSAANAHTAPRLELSLAGRFESYSDFGGTSNPKVGLRWAPTNSLKLRSSWGTSFRAPKLLDVHDSSQNVAILGSVKDPRSASGGSLILGLQGNNEGLREEIATTWTAGLDFVPARASGLTVSLTYYAIDYEHRILRPGPASPFDILLQEAQWGAVVQRNPSQSDIAAVCNSAIFRGNPAQCRAAPIAAIVDFSVRNLAATRVKGLDIRLDHSLDTRYGKLRFGFNGGYVFSFEQAVSDTSPPVDIVNTVGNPPALRLRGTLEWYQRDWDEPGLGMSLDFDHSGAYRDTEVQTVRSIGAYSALDIRLGYRTGRGEGSLDNLELGLNAANVFNRAPPFVDREGGYDILNFEPYGRVVSFSIQKKW